jgi:8-oxo-dGTP diphosphatase
MELLAELTDADLGLDSRPPTSPKVRHAARAVLFDGEKVAIIHISKLGYHKIPGGGCEEGETPLEALRRELLEEAGCEARVAGEVGMIVEERRRHGLKHYNHCFLADVVKKRDGIMPTARERKNGLRLLWVAPQEAIRLFESDKTDDYGGKFMSRRDLIFLRQALSLRAH